LLTRLSRVGMPSPYFWALLREKVLKGLWQLFVDNDPGNPERYIVFMEQGGISLPDEAYYRDEEYAGIREAFGTHLERVFTLVGLDEVATRASHVMKVETRSASHHWDKVKCRDAEATYNLWDAKKLGTTLETFPLQSWLTAAGITPQAFAEVVVRQPDFIEAVSGLWSDLSVEEIRDWMMWNTITAFFSLPDERSGASKI